MGANGAGKSTLLRNLAQKRLEGLPDGLRVALVQHAADSSVGGARAVDTEETVLEHLQREADEAGAAEAFLAQVGFKDPAVKVATLSGGWHMRLSLARAMLVKCDLLLLDEPTNHLDAEACRWLTAYLQTTEAQTPPMTVVVVSHDAAFLDAVVTDVVLLAHRARQLEAYEGTYSGFRRVRPEVHAYLTRRSDPRGGSSLAGGDKFTLQFPRPDRLDGVASDTKAVLRLTAVTFAYPSTRGGEAALSTVLRHVDGKLSLKSKVAVLGGNGAGKSTLVRLMVGDLLPVEGDVWRHPSLRVAYVAQHSLGHIEHHLGKTPVEYLQWRFAGAVDREALSMAALQTDGDAASGGGGGGSFELEKFLARRTRHGQLEYECKFVGRGHDENEWRSVARLAAEGHAVACQRYDQVGGSVGGCVRG